MIGAMTGRSPADSSALTLAVAEFLQTCRSANTEAAYRLDLEHFAKWCATGDALNLLTIAAEDLARYRSACELAGASPATVARRLSAIVSFSGYATERGLAPALADSSHVERPTVEPASTADELSDAEADALLEAADRESRRAAAMIRLLMLDGLKVGEAIRADAADVHGRPPQVTLTVAGRRTPILALHAETAAATRRYLGARRQGPLFVSELRGQAPKRLTRFGADYLIKQVARTAGIERSISANALRRRYVIAAHASGTDLDAIREKVGHVTRRTTRRYLAARRPESLPTT